MNLNDLPVGTPIDCDKNGKNRSEREVRMRRTNLSVYGFIESW